jgi:hypothetical protein
MLAVNKPGDADEREADRIADQVSATVAHPAVSNAPPRIQRFSGQSHRQVEGVPDAAPASVGKALASPGRPLEPGLRQDMERRFGYDFSPVRVHSDAAAGQSAKDMNADAYTVGHAIVFGSGRLAPEISDGRRLLAHELTHVVQQSSPANQRQARPIARKPRTVATASARPAVREMTREEAQAILIEYIARMPDESSAAMEAIVTTLRMSSTVKNWKMRLRQLSAAFSLLDAQSAATVLKALTSPVGDKQKYLKQRFGRLDSDFRAPLLDILRKRAVAKSVREEEAAAKPSQAKETWVELQEGVFAFQVSAGTTINDVAAYLSGHPDLPNVLAQLNNVSCTTPLEEAYPVIVSIDFIDREQAIRDMPAHVRNSIASARQAQAQQAQYRRFVKVRSGHPYGGVGLIPLTTAAITAAAVAVKYLAGLIVGLLKGAWNAVEEMFVGAVDMIKTVGRVLYRLITGDFGGIWKMLTGFIDKLKLLWRNRGEIASDFMDKWMARDPWERGLFQGKVLGWVMMTVLIVIVTAGAGAIAQIAGKWKFVIDALKLADRVGDLGTYARAVGKLPGAATDVVRKKLGGTAVQVTEKAGTKPTQAILKKGAAREARELAKEGLLAKRRTADGHDIMISRDGRMWICTTCDEFRTLYRNVIARDKHLADELDMIEKIADPNQKAKALEAWKLKVDNAIIRMTPPRRVHPHVIPKTELPQRQPPQPAPPRTPEPDFEDAPTLVWRRHEPPRGSVRPARGGTDRDVDIVEGEIEVPGPSPTQALPRFDFRKLPVPEGYRKPDGTPDLQRFGLEVIKWGHGTKEAQDLAEMLTKKGRKSRAYKKHLKKKGVTPEMARAWADFYKHESKRMSGSTTPPARVELMLRIAELLKP